VPLGGVVRLFVFRLNPLPRTDHLFHPDHQIGRTDLVPARNEEASDLLSVLPHLVRHTDHAVDDERSRLAGRPTMHPISFPPLVHPRSLHRYSILTSFLSSPLEPLDSLEARERSDRDLGNESIPRTMRFCNFFLSKRP